MPDRILKPDSGNDLVLQNDDGSGKIEINENASIPVTGTLDVSGATLTTSSAQKQAIVQAGPGSGTFDVSSGTFTTSSAQKQAIVDGATIEAQDLASGSGTTLPNNVQDAITRLGTVTSGTFNGTIGSSAIFPAGHIITHSTYYSGNAATYYETDSSSYTDMGLEISITPKNSSTDSFIVVNFYSGLSQNEAATGVATINYSTSSGVTTESSSTQLVSSSYQMYIGALNNSSVQILHQNYSANTTQYYRIFLKSNSNTNNVRLIHQNATFSFYAYEVKK